MLAKLQSKALALAIAALMLLAAWWYWQHVTGQRDAYQAEAERQRTRADVLQEHQQWQRQQIETLNEAMAARDRALDRIALDMSASRTALEQLGETDAQARDWMDGDVPGGIADWVRQLQTGDARDDGSVPDRARPPDQRAAGTPVDTAR
ncbi:MULTISPECIES: hypothetical protein [unclassified Halomonas]|uniref:hypothetical protein n=1 Tax=unclassified Halomonas TaxID=2609666 RepID=UPI0020769092|nr:MULTISPECIES: hypothetical protein [unclassified Halomonas]